MADIVTWTQDNLLAEKIHPLLTVSVFIVQFLAIRLGMDWRECE
jgi:queuine/archaeosine tRNA-ribosyltransferase